MRLLRFFSGLTARRQFCLLAAVALAVGGASVGALVKADVVAFDDFEGLTLVPFTVASGVGDGTDWTNMIRTGTAREWTIDNSAMVGTTTESAYYGWTAMDVDSWIAEQGEQIGRSNIGGAGSNNTVCVADPDAWDDYTTGAGTDGYNSFMHRSYDLTGFDETTVTVTMDYIFYSEVNQLGTIEVSFDAGTTWIALATFDSSVVGNDVLFQGVAGTDFFNVSGTSSTMLLRMGCSIANNNWFFAFDNVTVATGDGFSDTEDFEGLTLEKFTVAGSIGDGLGTDWTADIPEWTVDNSNNLSLSLELGYDGWTAMDVQSWAGEQGGQGRTLFNTPNPNNTVLVGDGDAFYDYDVDLEGNPWPADPGAPAEALNTYISRTYDLSGYDNCTLVIDYLYEFRIENQQLGVAEISFDGGSTWIRLQELDNNDGANNDVLADLAVFTAGTDFQARQSDTMILRFGYLLADNNWWFAIDEVQIQADPITYVKGDANNDGTTNNLDLAPFVLAILDRTQYEATYGLNPDLVLDFDCSGVFNNLDIAGFINVILGN